MFQAHECLENYFSYEYVSIIIFAFQNNNYLSLVVLWVCRSNCSLTVTMVAKSDNYQATVVILCGISDILCFRLEIYALKWPGVPSLVLETCLVTWAKTWRL